MTVRLVVGDEPFFYKGAHLYEYFWGERNMQRFLTPLRQYCEELLLEPSQPTRNGVLLDVELLGDLLLSQPLRILCRE